MYVSNTPHLYIINVKLKKYMNLNRIEILWVIRGAAS